MNRSVVASMPGWRRLVPWFLLLFSSTTLEAQAQILFSETSAEAGIPAQIRPSYGVSVGDLNGDGLPDIFINNHSMRHSIFRNDPNNPGIFQDVVREVDAEGYWFTPAGPGDTHPGGFEDTHGAAWMDFDNDGDEDLAITAGVCCAPQFMVNENGLLYYRTTEWGLGDNSQKVDSDREGRSVFWYDSDLDGVLELSLITTFTAQWLEQVNNTFMHDSGTGYNCNRNHFAVALDFAGDDALEVLCVSNGGSFVRRAWNVSTRPFTNVDAMLPDIQAVTDIVIGDFDGNQRNDMLMTKGALRPSQVATQGRPERGEWGVEALIINRERAFSFRTAGKLHVSLDWNKTFFNFSNIDIGAEGRNPGNELAFDLDPSDPTVVGIRSRAPDIQIPEFYIGYFPDDPEHPEAGGTWKFELYPEPDPNKFLIGYIAIRSDAPVEDLDDFGTFNVPFERAQLPTLLLNNDDGLVDATEAAGLASALRCVSGVAGDFDNDMDLDVYLVCRDGAQNLPNILLENDGTGRFTVVPNAGGAAGVTGLSVMDGAGNGDSVASLDYDLDGRLDLVVVNGLNLRPRVYDDPPIAAGGPRQLFNNKTTTGNWIQIDLVGTAAARDALGSKVYVDAGGVRQYREQNGGFHRWSQNSKRLHFGLAANTRANVTVRWPNGTTETFENVTANHFYRITEGDGIERVFDGAGASVAFLHCPGDIDGDNIADLAFASGDGVTVKTLNGSLVSQFSLDRLSGVIDMELMPDVNANGAPELVALSQGPVAAHVRDLLTGDDLGKVVFAADLAPVDLELIADRTGNGIPELATLGQNPARVQVRDGLTGALIRTVAFADYVVPQDLGIYRDMNANLWPELAVLGDNRRAQDADTIEIRDPMTGNIVREIWLGKGWGVLQQARIADLNGNGSEEVAVLRRHPDGRVEVQIRDSVTKAWLRVVEFAVEYPPAALISIADLNGNGAEELALFGRRSDGIDQKAVIKDSKTGQKLGELWFDRNFPGQDFVSCGDINGNGATDLALLGRRASDGALKAIVKDSKTGERLGLVKF